MAGRHFAYHHSTIIGFCHRSFGDIFSTFECSKYMCENFDIHKRLYITYEHKSMSALVILSLVSTLFQGISFSFVMQNSFEQETPKRKAYETLCNVWCVLSVTTCIGKYIPRVPVYYAWTHTTRLKLEIVLSELFGARRRVSYFSH